MPAPEPHPIVFTAAVRPRAKGRARYSGRHATRRFYTPAPTTEFEDAIGRAARAAMEGASPLTGPVDVHVLIRLRPCASTSKTRANAMIGGAILPAKTPDVDNVAKGVLDGCKGIAFVDDRQVIRLISEKTYSSSEGVDVCITSRTEAAG
ncbi:RusA family crossover junction endodeoxyribonuclease [Brevundimonas sp. TWP2-3-2]|uniref:RusA family crossover junction endodeoxyribonuclease n=1 Tax=unclassified Brevundimonas TaxID=2622653 RepID=UPI003CF95002